MLDSWRWIISNSDYYNAIVEIKHKGLEGFMDNTNIGTVAMSTVDTISFASSIASLILSVLAIILSIVFYKMSSDESKSTIKAAQDIEANVKKLEQLFDRLYSDTFSMMKDTVTDMRNHIWKNPQSGQTDNDIENEKIDIKSEVKKQIEDALSELNLQKETSATIEEKVEKIVSELLEKNKPKERTLPKEVVLSVIKRFEPLTIRDILKRVSIDEEELVLKHLFPLREEGKISWEGEPNSIRNSSVIYAVKSDRNTLKNYIQSGRNK